MNSHALSSYTALFTTSFREVQGAVIASQSGDPIESPPDLSDAMSAALYENQQNRRHFTFNVGSGAWELWQNNLVLARAVQEHWRLKLRHLFPERESIIYISNELALTAEPHAIDAIWIMPTLRLWSASNDPEGKLQHSFLVHECGPDQIDIRHQSKPLLVHASDVFTRGRSVRRSFLRTVQNGDHGSRIYF